LLDKLPQIASAVAQPLAKTERIVVISSGGDNQSGSGAARVTRDVTDTMAQMPAVIEALTGINLIDLLKALPAVQAAKPAGGESGSTTDTGSAPDGGGQPPNPMA